MGKTKYHVLSAGKEYEYYSSINNPFELVRAHDDAARTGPCWIEVRHFGYTSLVRWDTVTRVELADQNVSW